MWTSDMARRRLSVQGALIMVAEGMLPHQMDRRYGYASGTAAALLVEGLGLYNKLRHRF
jgi:hypothetical protein